MALSPLDIQNIKFKKGFRGYKISDVDNFSDILLKDYEALYKENDEMRKLLIQADEQIKQYKSIETTLNNTLILAQQQAEEVKKNAENAAQIILEEAKIKAEKKIHDAEARVKGINRHYEDFTRKVEQFKTKYRAFLKAQLDLVSNVDDDDIMGSSEMKEEKNHDVVSEEQEQTIVAQASAHQEVSSTNEILEETDEEKFGETTVLETLDTIITDEDVSMKKNIPFWKKFMPTKQDTE